MSDAKAIKMYSNVTTKFKYYILKMDKIKADNQKRIKQLEELIKERNIMKENHRIKRMIIAGLVPDKVKPKTQSVKVKNKK